MDPDAGHWCISNLLALKVYQIGQSQADRQVWRTMFWKNKEKRKKIKILELIETFGELLGFKVYAKKLSNLAFKGKNVIFIIKP